MHSEFPQWVPVNLECQFSSTDKWSGIVRIGEPLYLSFYTDVAEFHMQENSA